MAVMQAILDTYTVLVIHTVWTKLVNTNYTDYLGFTLRYLYGLNTGDYRRFSLSWYLALNSLRTQFSI
jgi:hypothetical protein